MQKGKQNHLTYPKSFGYLYLGIRNWLNIKVAEDQTFRGFSWHDFFLNTFGKIKIHKSPSSLLAWSRRELIFGLVTKFLPCESRLSPAFKTTEFNLNFVQFLSVQWNPKTDSPQRHTRFLSQRPTRESTPDRPVSCRSHSQSQLLKFLTRGFLAKLSLEWGVGKESVCVFEGNLFSNSTVEFGTFGYNTTERSC